MEIGAAVEFKAKVGLPMERRDRLKGVFENILGCTRGPKGEQIPAHEVEASGDFFNKKDWVYPETVKEIRVSDLWVDRRGTARSSDNGSAGCLRGDANLY